MAGLEFTRPTLIDAAVVAKLEQLVPLVPLHQPHNLAAVKGVMQLRPDLAQVACFDTAFHRTKTRRWPIDSACPMRCFSAASPMGFSRAVLRIHRGQFRQIAPDISAGRVIVAPPRQRRQPVAMKNGQSVDTTMSFSALDGLPMGTQLRKSRSGRGPFPAPARLER